MTERSTIAQTVQIGVETTPGTAVAATKRLKSLSIEPSIDADIKTFRPMGSKYPSLTALGKEFSTAKLSGPATYSELIYPLASIIGNQVPVIIGGGPGYTWDFNPKNVSEDTVVTFSVEVGSAVRAHKYSYGLVTSWGIQFSRDEVTQDGEMIGQQITDGVQLSTNEVQRITMTGTPTGGSFTITYDGQTTAAVAYNAAAGAVQSALEALSNIAVGDVVCTGGPFPGTAVDVEFRGAYAQTNVTTMTTTDSLTGGTTPATAVTTVTPGAAPTEVELVPILGKQVSIYCDDTAANLGVTKLLRVLEAEFKLENRFGPLWVLDQANQSWVAHVEIEPTCTTRLFLEADAAGMALLAIMRAGTSRFIRIEGVGDAFSGGTYLIRVDVCGQVSEVGDYSDQDGVYAIEWTFTAIQDATWGKPYMIRVQNKQVTL